MAGQTSHKILTSGKNSTMDMVGNVSLLWLDPQAFVSRLVLME
jgi:hypothetical protein